MYGIIRVNKIKITSLNNGRLQGHNQRELKNYQSNGDVDISKIKEDISFIQSEDFKKSVQEQLEKYNITKKPRKDAIGVIDGVLTASPEFFEGKSKQNIIDFFKKSIPLIQREFGPLISATIHFDEKTPHMHFDCVPIVKTDKGFKLCAKDKLGTQVDFIKRQDRFYDNYFSKYGLDRGISKEQTKKEHIEQNRFKAAQAEKDYIDFCRLANKQKGIYQDMLIRSADMSENLQKVQNEVNKLIGYTKAKKAILSEIEALKGIREDMVNELIEVTNYSDMARELMHRSIMSGRYDDAEYFKDRLQDSEEAQSILNHMDNLYQEYQSDNIELD